MIGLSNEEDGWFELILTRLKDVGKCNSGGCMAEMAGE